MTGSTALRFLVDEDVPRRVVDKLTARGFDLVVSRDEIGTGRPDTHVALRAIEDDRIVLTRNVRHFRRLSRMPRFHELSYLGIGCGPEIAHERIAELLDVITFVANRDRRTGQPFNMEIGNETFSFRDRRS